MSEGREIRCYEYVNRPYAVVRAAVHDDPEGLFHRATQAAATRAGSIAAELSVDIGGVEIAKEIDLVVDAIEDDETRPGSPITRVRLHWRARNRPQLFPTMQAELSLYPLGPDETQLDLAGIYRPPFGVLGAAMNALVGHRIADAAVHRFVDNVAARLVLDLAKQGSAFAPTASSRT